MEQNAPAYPIASVDHALRLALLLEEAGPLSVSAAADMLGVARSTAHRLLAMLVYRGFAEQGDDRRYRSGPVLSSEGVARLAVTRLKAAAIPVLRTLAGTSGETAHLMVLAGTDVEFLASEEASQLLRVGSRKGRRLPAERTSGGLALLAQLSVEEVHKRYAGRDDIDIVGLSAELRRVRSRGFAVNDQMTERGVTAIGVCTPEIRGQRAALALAVPSARIDLDDLGGHVEALHDASNDLGAAMGEQLP